MKCNQTPRGARKLTIVRQHTGPPRICSCRKEDQFVRSNADFLERNGTECVRRKTVSLLECGGQGRNRTALCQCPEHSPLWHHSEPGGVRTRIGSDAPNRRYSNSWRDPAPARTPTSLGTGSRSRSSQASESQRRGHTREMGRALGPGPSEDRHGV
jgi:hypothetical protein